MRRKHYIISALLLCSLLLSGCGKRQDNSSSTSPSPTTGSSVNSQQKTDSSDGEGKQPGADNPQDANMPEGDNAQPIETPVPKSATVSRKKEYSDSERTVSILGLQEYKKIKSEQYTDKAAKGKKYLVLFLEVYNKKKDKDYFNVNYLSAKVDGKEIENTFLFNEPEGYQTIFANIAGSSTAEGFIVWEVPEKWKKMEVTYAGWRDSDGLTLDAKLTKKDLKNPGKASKK